MNDPGNPKLRMVDAQPLVYEGESYLMLRDPLLLSETTLLIPQPLIPVLAMCDGSRSAAGMRAAMALRYGIYLTNERIQELINALDHAFLLENEHFRQERARALVEFRRQNFRPPSSAGASYPESPEELSDYLGQFFPNGEHLHTHNAAQTQSNGRIRGLVSPHIDYQRGGPVYAQVWGLAAQAAQEAELAIILGTDHFSEGLPFSLTRQNYATPFGILPTDTNIVDRLADVIGEDLAFAGELHHRREHSIELAAVWLHYIRGGRPISVVPILTGSLEIIQSMDDGRMLENILLVLQEQVNKPRTIVIAAGDMAHVGPAFDTEAVNPGSLIQLKSADDELIQNMCRGDAEGFLQSIQRVNDANNVCGVSPIYLTLRLLNPLTGQNLGYAVCPADENNTSVVTICGTVFH